MFIGNVSIGVQRVLPSRGMAAADVVREGLLPVSCVGTDGGRSLGYCEAARSLVAKGHKSIGPCCLDYPERIGATCLPTM